MPYVRVTRDVLLTRGKFFLRGLPAGYRGPAPQHQIDEIVDRKAGVALTRRGDGAKSAAELDAIEREIAAHGRA